MGIASRRLQIMRIQDRTSEFFASVSLKSQQQHGGSFASPQFGEHLLAGPGSPRGSSQRLIRQHAQFTNEAIEVNNGIKYLLIRLEKLTKLANSKRIYDDRSAEVKELTFIIKKELGALTQRMESLRALQQPSADESRSQGTLEHRTGVVSLLSGQLQNIHTRFTQVLQVSSSNMRAQEDRRGQFGAATAALLPNSTSTIAGPTQRMKPRSGTASPSGRDEQQHVTIDMPFQKMALAPQENTAYLESRSSALNQIESTIQELGSIYQQLAHMITQQGESIQRIDMNIEDMQMNVQRGQEQLMRYLRSVSSNRWLMIKIFAVLIIFSIFFMFLFS